MFSFYIPLSDDHVLLADIDAPTIEDAKRKLGLDEPSNVEQRGTSLLTIGPDVQDVGGRVEG